MTAKTRAIPLFRGKAGTQTPFIAGPLGCIAPHGTYPQLPRQISNDIIFLHP